MGYRSSSKKHLKFVFSSIIIRLQLINKKRNVKIANDELQQDTVQNHIKRRL